MSLKLYIRDNTDGTVHEYGTNKHDALILQDDGSLHYENMQNCAGTMFPKDGYTFCLEDGSDPRDDEECREYSCDPYVDIGGDYWRQWRNRVREIKLRVTAKHRKKKIKDVKR